MWVFKEDINTLKTYFEMAMKEIPEFKGKPELALKFAIAVYQEKIGSSINLKFRDLDGFGEILGSAIHHGATNLSGSFSLNTDGIEEALQEIAAAIDKT